MSNMLVDSANATQRSYLGVIRSEDNYEPIPRTSFLFLFQGFSRVAKTLHILKNPENAGKIQKIPESSLIFVKPRIEKYIRPDRSVSIRTEGWQEFSFQESDVRISGLRTLGLSLVPRVILSKLVLSLS